MPTTPITIALATLQSAINRYGAAVKTDSTGQNNLIAALNNLTTTIQNDYAAHATSNTPHGGTAVGMGVLRAATALAARSAIGAVAATDNVASATKLATARKINGVNFDGTADITISAIDQVARDASAAAQTAANAASSLASSKLDAGATASAATKLATTRKINGTNFDGSADITVPAIDQTARDTANGCVAKTTFDQFLYKFTGVIQKDTWSRVLTVNRSKISGSMRLQVNYTRTNVVCSNLFDLTYGHAGTAQILTMGDHGYSDLGLRITTVNNYEMYIELYDRAIDQNFTLQGVEFVIMSPAGDWTPHTVFTQGSGTVCAETQTANKKLKVDNYEIYHQGNKPTPADIGAVANGTKVANAGYADSAGTAVDQTARTAAANAQNAAATASSLAAGRLDLNATAVAATKLATARKINGTNFDGTGDITIGAVDTTARDSASTAQGTANAARTAADNAQGTANTAQATANSAQAFCNSMTFEY